MKVDDSRYHELVESGTWVAVVDDDPTLRLALVRLLRAYGIPAASFRSAEDFLDHAVRRRPSCIILDVHLGGLSGFELQDRLQAAGDQPPIIFVTGRDDVAPGRLEARAGGCGYLWKPFDSHALIALVRLQLRLHGRATSPAAGATAR